MRECGLCEGVLCVRSGVCEGACVVTYQEMVPVLHEEHITLVHYQQLNGGQEIIVSRLLPEAEK